MLKKEKDSLELKNKELEKKLMQKKTNSKKKINDLAEDQQKLDKFMTENSEQVENQDLKIRPHANAQEYIDMNLLHGRSVEEIEEFLRKLTHHKYSRALEVACGRGLLTRDLLSKKYKSVDMFDQSNEAIKEAGDSNIGSRNVVITEVNSMEAFDFTQCPQYSAIYLRWCIGYLERPD